MALRIFVCATCVVILGRAPVAAQDTRAEVIAHNQAQKAQTLTPERAPAGGRFLRRMKELFDPTPPAIVPTFGGVRGGSGPAFGAALIAPVSRAELTTGAAWSFKNTKRVRALVRVPAEVLGGTGVTLSAWWEDAPRTQWFGFGMQNGSRQRYGLTTTSVSADAALPRWHALNVTGGIGYLRTDATLIGASTWVETTIGAAIDTRTSPGYTRRGGLYSVRYTHAAAQTGGYAGFGRTTIDLRQFVPVFHENWILAGRARAELTNDADATPFFLLPSLGGGNALRGYSRYRFVDRQAMLLSGELRWVASEALDLAVFVDEGVVAPTIKRLRIDDLVHAYGIGARFHTRHSSAFRIDVARGSEGWQLHFSQDVSF